MATLQDRRRFFAEFIVRSSGSGDAALIEAFASTPREHYLGPGPWPVFVGGGRYLTTPTGDPQEIYHDLLVGLATDRGINNGQPTLHARCIAALALRVGERVLHIGAGSGYYTAVIAALVGPQGRVTAFEIESDLAAAATRNLQHLPQVVVIGASGSEGALPPADAVYVNAGATHPLASWLDTLNIRGRLVFPLTPNEGLGCMLKVTKLEDGRYAAEVLVRAAFVPCIGARDDAASVALASALETQSIKAVKSLRRGEAPDRTAWCVGKGWWLSTAAT